MDVNIFVNKETRLFYINPQHQAIVQFVSGYVNPDNIHTTKIQGKSFDICIATMCYK